MEKHSRGRLGVGAWSLSDAHDALLVHNTPDTDRDVSSVIVFTDRHRDLWGEPSHDHWSVPTLRRLLEYIQKAWSIGNLVLGLHSNDHLSPLLDNLAQLPQHLLQNQDILVRKGVIGLDKLETCMTTCKEKGVRLTLRDTCIEVPGGSRVESCNISRLVEGNSAKVRKLRGEKCSLQCRHLNMVAAAPRY